MTGVNGLVDSALKRHRAVFLDRDGVLNAAVVRNGLPYPPKSRDDVTIIAGVEEACVALKKAGFLLLVVTNQPDISRGTTTSASVDEINRYLVDRLELDAAYVCPHDDSDRCRCRKPGPGLIEQAAADWDVDLGRSFIVGDRWRDIEAGRNAGVNTAFVDYGYAEPLLSEPDVTEASLAGIVPFIVE